MGSGKPAGIDPARPSHSLADSSDQAVPFQGIEQLDRLDMSNEKLAFDLF